MGPAVLPRATPVHRPATATDDSPSGTLLQGVGIQALAGKRGILVLDSRIRGVDEATQRPEVGVAV
jgi:hypothetical protein